MVKLFSVLGAVKVYLNPVDCGVLTFLPGFTTLFRLADVAYHLGICDINLGLFFRRSESQSPVLIPGSRLVHT